MTLLKRKIKISGIAVSFFRYLIIIGLCFMILYPLFISAVISIMNTADIYDSTVRFIPKTPTILNYTAAIHFIDYWAMLAKSVLFDGIYTLIEILICLSVAYGFARFKFPGHKLFFSFVIITLIIPTHIYLMPLYLSFQSWGPFNWDLISTPLPMLFMSVTGLGMRNGLIIYIMRQYFSGYPKELEEAAFIDGAGTMRVFTRIMLPGAASVSMTGFMLCFVWKWTDTTYTGVFKIGEEYIWTKMASFQQLINTSGGTLVSDYYYQAILKNASIILYIVPLLLLFLFFKRFLVESIETTGLVG